MKPKHFAGFSVGDRVCYTGCTSYHYQDGQKVYDALGTIVAVGHSVTIELDSYRKPHWASDPRDREGNPLPGSCLWIIPAKQYANVAIADMVQGTKELRKI